MKKLLSLAFCTVLSFNALQAQDKSVVYVYDEPTEDGDIFGSDFCNVSPNGKYAVGYDGLFTESSFIWDAESKQVRMIEPYNDKNVFVNDVDNGGILYGNFADEEGLYTPGYAKDGVWHALPMPSNIKESSRKSDTYAPCAQAVSDDGKYIAGHAFYKQAEGEGGEYRPILWVDGVLKEFNDLETFGQGFYVYDVNNDGTIIAGWATTDFGHKQPAIIEDGKAKILYEYDEAKGDYVLECVATYIDRSNNVTGYVVDEADKTHTFLYNKKDGFKFVSDRLGTCSFGTDNLFTSDMGGLGDAYILKDEVERTVVEYFDLDTKKTVSNIRAISADGRVLVGAGLTVSEMGAFNVPCVIMLSEEDALKTDITSINQADYDKVTAELSGNQLFVTGTYNKVEIYNTTGALVITDNQQGHAINMGNQTNGIYIVKVWNGQNAQTFKVVKY